jgi:enterobactin C-glucosyltransferase
MRVLFVTPPGYGLLFPLVPIAHALRAAGHDVLLATTGSTQEVAAQAGLTVVDVAPDADLQAIFARTAGQFGATRSPQALREHRGPSMFVLIGEAMVDGTIALAREWGADLVVHTPHGTAGQYAAAALGLPAVFHGLGFGHTPAMLTERNGPSLDGLNQRFGLAGVPQPDLCLDVAPPSMRLVEDYGLALRPTPYNGGGVLPGWLFTPAARPRITVTLGTVTPSMGGLGPVSWVVEAAREVDAEFVLALGGSDLSSLGALPDNVRPVGWVPLGALLAGSAAVVHHGGAGTTLTAVAAGLPQLVLPQGADQFANAAAVQRRGVGRTAEPADFGPALLRELLDADHFRTAAAEVRAELATMPTPADLVPALVDLVKAP